MIYLKNFSLIAMTFFLVYAEVRVNTFLSGNEYLGALPFLVCLFYILRKTTLIPPFIYTVRSCIYIAALFYFSTILFERRTPLLLCPSAKKCSRSISSRAFCEFLRSRRVFSGAISRDKSDGRRINIQREREKKSDFGGSVQF